MEPSLLPSLAWFVHIAHHRSFTKAAEEMGVSRAALSQNLKSLEHQLGVKLLYRTTRDMSLAEHVVAVPITPPLSMVVAGSPDYFARHGKPDTPQHLAIHNCINYRYSGSGALHDWDFKEPGKRGQHFTVAVTGNLTTNDDEGMTRAAVAGLGLIQNIDIAIREHLRDGSLVPVLTDWTHTQAGFHLYVPTRDQMPAKMRALMDFLIEKRGNPRAA